MSLDKYAAISAIAKQTERSLLDAGASPEQAEEVLQLITRIAGSYLPPVSGTFNIQFDDAKVN